MINIVRIEKHLYETVCDRKGLLGHVEQIYHTGFHVTTGTGDIVYFQGGPWLQSPFSIVLDGDVNRWMSDVSLSHGDTLCIDGDGIHSSNNAHVKLRIHEPEVIDLQHTAIFTAFDESSILSWAQEIVHRLSSYGRCEGVLATLGIFKECWPELHVYDIGRPNRWSQSALPGIMNLLHAAVARDAGLFEHAWDTLTGLGPGLTPSGDDLLVGFLSIQHKFNSPIKRWVYTPGVIDHIVRKNDHKTTSISAQFLKCASNGLFSEQLMHVIDSIVTRNQAHKKKRYSALDDFLRWGHTSGTDTMVGVLMGLFTLVAVEGN